MLCGGLGPDWRLARHIENWWRLLSSLSLFLPLYRQFFSPRSPSLYLSVRISLFLVTNLFLFEEFY